MLSALHQLKSNLEGEMCGTVSMCTKKELDLLSASVVQF